MTSKHFHKLPIRRLAALFLCSCVTACNDNTELVDIVEDGEAGITSLKASNDDLSLAVGQTFTLSTTAIYDGGQESRLTDGVRWQSRNDKVVTVNENGDVTAIAPGSAIISYHWRRINGSVGVTVSAAELASLRFSSNAIEANECSLASVSATADYTDGSSQPISSTAEWTSANEEVVDIQSLGTQTASLLLLNSGSTEITLSSANVTSTLPVTVLDTLSEIRFDIDELDQLDELVVETGTEQTLTTIGLFSDGTEATVDNVASYAFVSGEEDGAFQSGGTQSLDTQSLDAQSSILEPSPNTGPLLNTHPDLGTETDLPAETSPDNLAKEVTANEVILATSSIAEIIRLEDDSIVVRASQPGSINLATSCGGQSALLRLTVQEPPQLTAIGFDVTDIDINPGEELTLEPVASYSDGTQTSLVDTTQWSIIAGDSDSFQLDTATGLLTANADIQFEQSVIVQATYQTATAEIEVFANRGVREEVIETELYYINSAGNTEPLTGDSVQLSAGDTLQLKLKSIYNTGREEFSIDDLFWSNLNPQIASIDGTGLLTAHSAGISTIFAIRNNTIATLQFTVEDVSPVSPNPVPSDSTGN